VLTRVCRRLAAADCVLCVLAHDPVVMRQVTSLALCTLFCRRVCAQYVAKQRRELAAVAVERIVSDECEGVRGQMLDVLNKARVSWSVRVCVTVCRAQLLDTSPSAFGASAFGYVTVVCVMH
jgi:hypothetical protein